MDAKELFVTVLGVKNPELLRELCSVTTMSDVAKGTMLVRCGEPQRSISFLMDGVFRGYFFDVDGKEVTDCFGVERGAPAMSSFGLNNTAQDNIEMLTKGRIACVAAKDLMRMLQLYPEALMIYNRMLTAALQNCWEMKTISYQYTAQQRYEWFLKKYPGLIEQISNKYIASFLGMNPVTLSRLRCGQRDAAMVHNG